MRRYRFRAWHVPDQKMYFVCAIHTFLVNGIAAHLVGHEYKRDKESTFISDKHLMERTGLDDKNGVQMWEGDIVKSPVLGIGSVEFVKYVTGNEQNEDILAWCFNDPKGSYHALDPQCNWEVIGNIWEHPHLLENGK